MKALISPKEPVCFDSTGLITGYRIADVHETGFDVHNSLFWIDCADDVTNSLHYYDPIDKTIKMYPQSESEPEQGE